MKKLTLITIIILLSSSCSLFSKQPPKTLREIKRDCLSDFYRMGVKMPEAISACEFSLER